MASPLSYEEQTRALAAFALGESMAARIIQWQIAVYLVELGILPRAVAGELVDTAIVAVQSSERSLPPLAVTQAVRCLEDLLRHLRAGGVGPVPFVPPGQRRSDPAAPGG